MSNKIQKPGKLPSSTRSNKVGQENSRRRSPGWIKAREERTERRANDPAVQERKRGHLAKALELESSKRRHKEVTEKVTKMVQQSSTGADLGRI